MRRHDNGSATSRESARVPACFETPRRSPSKIYARTQGAAAQHEGSRCHADCRNEASRRARTAAIGVLGREVAQTPLAGGCSRAPDFFLLFTGNARPPTRKHKEAPRAISPPRLLRAERPRRGRRAGGGADERQLYVARRIH